MFPIPVSKEKLRGNVSYLTALGVAVAAYNNTNRALMRFVHYGRNNNFSMSSVGLFADSYPIFLVREEGDTPETLIAKVQQQVSFIEAHIDYPYFENNISGTSRIVRFIYQKDIMDLGNFAVLIKDFIELDTHNSKLTDSLCGFSVIDNTADEKLIFLIRYAGNCYSDESIENFRNLFFDAALTGQFLGASAVAVEDMVTPVVLIGVAVASIMSAGNSTICSNESGKGNVDEINRVFSTTLAVSVGISTACMVFTSLFASAVCRGLGLTPQTELFNLTVEYMIGYIPVMPILSVIMTLPTLLQIEGDNKTGLISVSLVFILDIVFDLLNLFVFKGGVFGMALATTLSYYVAGAVVLVRFFGKKRTVKFSFKFVEIGRVGKILSYGTPYFINAVCFGLTTAALNVAFLQFGSENLCCRFYHR